MRMSVAERTAASLVPGGAQLSRLEGDDVQASRWRDKTKRLKLRIELHT